MTIAKIIVYGIILFATFLVGVKDTHEDDGGLMGLEENGDWEGIVAWMPLPEPFKEVE